MRFSGITAFTVLAMVFASSCQKTEENGKLINFVDPFIGTGGHGHTFPGAALPFGMVQLSPDNNHEGWDWCSGYHYSWDTIAGFSHTHISGTGVPDLMDIRILPVDIPQAEKGTFTALPANRQYALFTHADEKAVPGYYSVMLKNGIHAELTATKRTGMHRYTFTQGMVPAVILDLGSLVSWDRVKGSAVKKEGSDVLSGYRFSAGWANNQKVFFRMQSSLPLADIWLVGPDGTLSPFSGAAISDSNQPALKILVTFRPEGNKPLLIKTGISSVSTEGAGNNLVTENPGWDFDGIRRAAEIAWEEALGSIRITSSDTSVLRTFYTALYHAFIQPNIYSDVTGEYRTASDEIKKDDKNEMYYTFSLWDTFRGWHPLMTIIAPEKVRAFVKAMMAHYHDFGVLPKWSLWGNETWCMIAYHSVPVLVDAWKKGLIDTSLQEEVYKAIRQVAMGEGPRRNLEGLDLYIQHGYLPADGNPDRQSKEDFDESVSKTLEWAYDDWCIAQMAKGLGKEEDYAIFTKRAEAYKLLADPTTRLMRPRNADGSWAVPFRPEVAQHGNGYTEGNAWQYSWFVPHDITGLMEFMGGKERFSERLDTLFDVLKAEDIHFPDVTGLIGQYAHGNEPSHHVAYLYNYAGKPWKTQERVRHILKTMYTDRPDGLSGNEDCGQMSAWYILSAIGFYPVNPCGGVYMLGSPLVERAEIPLPGGKKFTISVMNQSPENIYIQSVALNGKPYNKCFIEHATIMQGGKMEIVLGKSPKQGWGQE